MVNRKVSLQVIFTVLILSLSFRICICDSSGLFFLGISSDKDSYSAGDNISLSTSLINKGDYPRPNMTLELLVIRMSDGSIVSRGSDIISAAAGEVVYINESVNLPRQMLSGNYSLSATLLGSSGAPVSFISKEVAISSPKETGLTFGQDGAYLEVQSTFQLGGGVTRTTTNQIYGTTGETIQRGDPMTLKFTLTNSGKDSINPTAILSVVPSYQVYNRSERIGAIETYNKNISVLAPGQSGTFGIELSISKPGTYSLKLEIYSGDEVIV